jgi:hypothetical protein
MMVLSRIWYIVLSLVLGVGLYVAYLAVGEYNRRNAVATNEELASDSQTVGWALQIDARRRLDALLLGSVDPGLQQALQGAEDKDKVPPKAKEDAVRALLAVNEKIPAEYKSDALFAVDHDGRVVAQIGFDQVKAFDDFELGGYPAVFDAMHGFLRDDTWVLGAKLYRVVARPVEFDVTQRPLGAIVGLRAVDNRFAQDISKRTRASVAFYAGGQRVASAVTEGFDANILEQVVGVLPKLAQDKSYSEGRSDVQMLGDQAGAIYARIPGDSWDLGGGFAVARPHITIANPLGFLSGADDKDKQAVNWAILALAIVVGIVGGLVFSILEHTFPMREMQLQAERLRKGEQDYFQLPRFRGGYRGIAQDVNAGIERVLEKGGGAVRKPADLESILGPVPAQPAMSAFSFPLADNSAPPVRPMGQGAGVSHGSGPFGPPQGPTREPSLVRVGAPVQAQPAFPPPGLAYPQAGPPQPPPFSMGAPPTALPGSGGTTVPMPSTLASPGPAYPFQLQPAQPVRVPHDDAEPDAPTMAAAQAPVQNVPPNAPGGFLAPAKPPRAPTMVGIAPQGLGGPAAGHAPPAAQGIIAPAPTPGAAAFGAAPTAPNAFFPPGRTQPNTATAPAASAQQPTSQTSRQASQGQSQGQSHGQSHGLAQSGPAASPGGPSGRQPGGHEEEQDEATVVAPAPNELLAAASGEHKAGGESAEWLTVYDDFVRTKKQCGEPTDGLTFEKFQHTLKKNRDALIQRHGCKRVRFSVYVKEGRASLKATPVRE